MDTWWGNASTQVMDGILMQTLKRKKKREERMKGWLNGALSYQWTRAGPGASMNPPGGAPGENGWSFSPAGAPGIPWSVGTGQGRGGGGQTRRTGGTEGAGWRKRLEGVDDLEDGGTEREGGQRRTEGTLDKTDGIVWQWYRGLLREATWMGDVDIFNEEMPPFF